MSSSCRASHHRMSRLLRFADGADRSTRRSIRCDLLLAIRDVLMSAYSPGSRLKFL